MMRYCRDCKKETMFDNSWSDDCYRCIECGCLPYLKEVEDKHE